MSPAYFAKKKRKKAAPKRYSSIPSKSGPEKIAAAKKLKAGNRKRAKANHERAYGGSYADWIRSKPCCACRQSWRKVIAAHTQTGGMSRKADAKTLAPLCESVMLGSRPLEGCHNYAHRVGHASLERLYGIDLKAIAASLWAEFSAGSSRGKA